MDLTKLTDRCYVNIYKYTAFKPGVPGNYPGPAHETLGSAIQAALYADDARALLYRLHVFPKSWGR